jgi:predicted nucleic acid-binding protein
MTHLLDVNVLLAAIWEEHPLHTRAFKWLNGKGIALCPLAELGFIRISTHPKASFNAPMDKTRELLKKFIAERKTGRIADDLPALESKAKKTDDVTDYYLADLATKHGFKLATLDGKIAHPAAELIP